MSELKKDEIILNGLSKFGDDFKSDTIKNEGLLKAKKNVTFKNLSSSGLMLVKENLYGGQIDSSGVLRAKGSFEGESIKSEGVLRILESIKTNLLDSFGLMKCRNVSADKIKIYGCIRADLITCDEFNVEFDTNCNVHEIEASSVNIKNVRKRNKRFKANTITADSIEVEYTKAKKITGDTVIIGKNCRVDLVEYQSNITIDPSSKVKKQLKV